MSKMDGSGEGLVWGGRKKQGAEEEGTCEPKCRLQGQGRDEEMACGLLRRTEFGITIFLLEKGKRRDRTKCNYIITRRKFFTESFL